MTGDRGGKRGPDPEARESLQDRSERSTRPRRARTDADASGGHEARRGKVLVVEDEPALARTIERILALEGLNAVVAGDGQAALDLLGSEPIELILLDLTLPKMNGYQFRARQLADDKIAKIPVVVLSAERAHGSMARLRADGFVLKPFTSDELLDVVKTVLDPD